MAGQRLNCAGDLLGLEIVTGQAANRADPKRAGRRQQRSDLIGGQAVSRVEKALRSAFSRRSPSECRPGRISGEGQRAHVDLLESRHPLSLPRRRVDDRGGSAVLRQHPQFAVGGLDELTHVGVRQLSPALPTAPVPVRRTYRHRYSRPPRRGRTRPEPPRSDQ